MSFPVSFSTPPPFKPVFSGDEGFGAEFSPHIIVPIADYYDGEYTITPSDEEQTIPIVGLVARQNITVNPIPSNYGRIGWNGAVLTVS